MCDFSNTDMKLVTLLLYWEQEALLPGIILCVERCYGIGTAWIHGLIDWKHYNWENVSFWFYQLLTLKMDEIEMQFSDFFTLGKLGYDQSVTNGRITVVLDGKL